MTSLLRGQVAVVTGAGHGIGRAISERLASAGVKVVAVDVDGEAAEATVAAIIESGELAKPLQLDVSDTDAVSRIPAEATASLGRIEILVNNAGILRATPAAQISSAEWDLVMRVNVTSAFLCAQAVYPGMKEIGGGRILNVASMAGRATSTLGGAHYTTSKAAILGLTRHLAREWASDGITVNAVSPGIVDTEMVRGSIDDRKRRQVLKTIPLRRFARPSEIADLVAFLVSPEAAYITGANVDIHGGELIIA